MPTKMMIEENFAFLFACIDVSGIKLDFKQIGEVCGLTVAAARMRFSRLRKAVESGELHGAYVHQPHGVSAQLLELANPGSRPIASKISSKLSKASTGSSIYSSTRKTPKQAKPDEKGESSDDKREIDTPSQRRSTRKRKADQLSGTGVQRSFFLPDEITTQIDDDGEDGIEQPGESDEEQDERGQRNSKRVTREPLSKASSAPRKTITFINRAVGPLSSPIPVPAALVGDQTNAGVTVLTVPKFSFFDRHNSNFLNEDEALEEEEVEEQSRTQERQLPSPGTIIKQHLDPDPSQYNGLADYADILPNTRSPGNFRTTTTTHTGQNIPNTPNHKNFTTPEQHRSSGQTSRELLSDCSDTHPLRTRRNVNTNRNYDQGQDSDNYSYSQWGQPKLSKAVRPCLPPSGIFPTPGAQKIVTPGYVPNIQEYPTNDNNDRLSSDMSPPLSTAGHQNKVAAQHSVPIDHSHPSSVLEGFVMPTPKDPDSLYNNPTSAPDPRTSHSPYSKSRRRSTTSTRRSKRQQIRNTDPTLSSLLPAPISRRSTRTSLLQRLATESAGHAARTPPAPTGSNPIQSEIATAQDKDKDIVDITVIAESIEPADNEIQPLRPGQPQNAEIHASRYTKKEMDVAQSLIEVNQGQQRKEKKKKGSQNTEKEIVDVANILVTMGQRNSM